MGLLSPELLYASIAPVSMVKNMGYGVKMTCLDRNPVHRFLALGLWASDSDLRASVYTLFNERLRNSEAQEHTHKMPSAALSQKALGK